jgi:glycosyltransferase involved in cell wall biosynthesis
MRVVMVGPFGLRPRGTMSVRALPMARALAARGHAVTVLLPPWQNPEDSGRCWEEGGVRVENISLPPRVPGLFHLLAALRLARRTLALRPDVVHLFKPKAYSGLVHWLLARLSRARRPRLVVDTDDWEGPGGWNDLAPYTPAQRRFFAWQERWGLAHAGAVTVASRTLENLVWALGVGRESVFYVPNGVGGWMMENGEWRMEDGEWRMEVVQPPLILLYTRFFEFPVSRVIDVLLRVRERVPEARLLVVGKGLFGEEEELLRLATQSGLTVTNQESRMANSESGITNREWRMANGELGMANHAPRTTHHVSRFTSHVSRFTFHASRFTPDVTYCGWVPPEALPAYFAHASVAIYPFDDTLVNRTKCAAKLLDLLAAGVPVVAEAVGQNREMIRHGETGWLVNPGDVVAFAGAVVRLLEDADLRARLGQAAARDVRERFAWENLAQTVERAYGA